MPASDFPHLVKHMAWAIYCKNYVRGSRERRLLASLEIAISRLVEWKFLEPVSLYGPPFRLTQKGRKREAIHNSENPTKTKKFDLFYKLIEEGFEGELPSEVTEDGGVQKRPAADIAQSRRAVVAASASIPTVRRRRIAVSKKNRERRPRLSTVKRAKRA